MIPGLVPEISPLGAFCDVVVVGVGVGVVGIGDSRSWIRSFVYSSLQGKNNLSIFNVIFF